MESRFVLLALGLAVLLFSGCISIDYTQKVDREGNSVITQNVDLSALLSANQDFASSESQLSGACSNISQSGNDSQCSYTSGVMTITKSVKASDNLYIFNKSSEFPYIIYTLEVRKVPQIASSEGLSSGAGSAPQTDSDFKDPSAKLGAATLKAAGASMTYSVEMPGEITSAENGDLVTDESGKKIAKYDVLDLMTEGEYIVVKSKELDMVLLSIVGGGIVLLIGGIAVAVVLMKAMKK
ncbi:MAG: hypothetical protein V1861_03325 [Candidatus Micrarchaeota archaeon]